MGSSQEALDKVMQLLTKALILTPLTLREPLLLYITATTQVVGAVLIVERGEEEHALKVQCPVYFVSCEVLADAKIRYPKSKSFSTPS
jgi:hypothetical protein